MADLIEVAEEIARQHWEKTEPASDLPKSVDFPMRKAQIMAPEPQKSDWPAPVQVAIVLLILCLLGLWVVFGR